MRNSLHAVGSAFETAWLLLRAAVSTSVSHWALSVVSLAAAFGLWFAVQDVENPRSEGIVPVEGGLPIQVGETNRPDGVVVATLATVQVLVEAREADLPNLRREDFRATVDLSGIVAGETVTLSVQVTTERGGVQILGVIPETIEVTATEVFSKTLPITLRIEGELPEDTELDGSPQIDPTFVTISGIEEQVGFVATVEAVIDISGLRESRTFEDVALVARTASGSPITTVTLSVTKVSIVYSARAIFTFKTVPIVPDWTGDPADGYKVTSAKLDVDRVIISGGEAFVESIESIKNEPIVITGAKATIQQRLNLAVPANITAEVTEVVLTITIEPIQTTAVLPATLTFVDLAEGLAIMPGTLGLLVTLRGPAEQISELAAAGLVVTISLDGLGEGTHAIQPEFVPPEGVETDPLDTIEVTLVTAAPVEAP